ncbi:ABC transporter substrate-binding protein [Paenibacillus ginsengarvi]|nr:extracellular solute-binding protein [Paenibacillus ginsengarvi]
MSKQIVIRKTVVTGMCTAALAGLLAGCGNQSESPKPDAPKPVQVEPVELVFYALSPLTGSDAEKAAQWTSYVQKKYPHISFKFINAEGDNSVDKITMANQPIDILFGSFAGFMLYKDRDLVTDMSALVKQMNFDLAAIEKPYIDLVQRSYDNKLPLLPVYDLRLGLYYNKDLFDKFGIAYPKDGVTWEELLTTAKQLTRTDGGVAYRGLTTAAAGGGLAINQYSLGYMNAQATDKAALYTDSWKRFFETIVPLFTVPGYAPTPELMAGGAQLKMFEQGTAAMLLAFNSYGTFNLPSVPINWDVATLPEVGGLRGIGAQPYPVYLGLSSTSKHREAAVQAISALLSSETQIDRSSKYGVFSPLKDPKAKAAIGEAAMWKGKHVQAFTAQTPAAPAPAVRAEFKTIAEGELNKAFLSVVNGEKDTNTALREAEEAANKAIQQVLSR